MAREMLRLTTWDENQTTQAGQEAGGGNRTRIISLEG